MEHDRVAFHRATLQIDPKEKAIADARRAQLAYERDVEAAREAREL